MLNFDADVKNTTARHQCENRVQRNSMLRIPHSAPVIFYALPFARCSACQSSTGRFDCGEDRSVVRAVMTQPRFRSARMSWVIKHTQHVIRIRSMEQNVIPS